MSEIKVFAKDYPMAPVDKFVPYANNARTHSKEQINKLRSIYRGIGYGDPVEVDENFTILSGHGRVEAAKAEGMKELPYVMLTGMTEAEKKAYILAVNRSALDAGWDEELLAVEIEALQEMGMDPLLSGFDEKELAALYGANDNDINDDDFDLSAALEKASFVEPGDIWTVGRHRLMCGDATKAEDVQKLMDGARANLIMTDPPYGVSFKSSSGLTIQNDSMKNEEFYIRGLVNYTYASCSSKNSVTRATYYKRSSATSWTNASKSFTSGTAFTFGGGNISTEYTYDVKYTLTDAFSTISVTDTVSTAAVLMDFLSGGRGIAIGKVAETENCLEVSQDWTTKLNGPVYLGTATLGAQNKPIYLSNGLPTASSVDIGSSTKPIYMHQGALTASTSTVGGAGTPVYLKAGALTACTPSSIVTSVVGDYVTSVGTSGIWTYRKWNSGAAECWGVYTASGVNIAKNNYSGFRYSDGISVNLPFTFAAAPAGVYSGGCTSYLTFVTPIGQPTTTQVKFWVACLDSSATSCSIVVNIHVMGKWK